MQRKRYKIATALTGVLLLSACSMESQSWINQNRVEVRNDEFTSTFETSKLDDRTLHAVGDYYQRFGNGPLNVVVSYDPLSKNNTQTLAKQSLEQIKEKLARNGGQDIHGAINPVKGTGGISTTLIRFAAITASAPSGCQMMPGYDNPATNIPGSANIDPDYKYGCTIETLLSRQVAHPADLIGRQGFETNADGRRQERVLSTRGYYGETSNTDLNGEKASGK